MTRVKFATTGDSYAQQQVASRLQPFRKLRIKRRRRRRRKVIRQKCYSDGGEGHFHPGADMRH